MKKPEIEKLIRKEINLLREELLEKMDALGTTDEETGAVPMLSATKLKEKRAAASWKKLQEILE